MLAPIFGSDLFGLVAIPFFIFFARILDVSLGTIRVIFISKGFKYIAPLIGFFEILIWLFAISQIVNHLNNPLYAVAYAAGFATGTFVGIVLEEKISLGMVLIQVVTRKSAEEMIGELRQNNFRMTVLDAQGSGGNAKMILLATKRHNISKALGIVRKFNPTAFYTIEDTKTAEESFNLPGLKSFVHSVRFFSPHKKAK